MCDVSGCTVSHCSEFAASQSRLPTASPACLPACCFVVWLVVPLLQVLLIHGFGASAYHFRYNVPELAKQCQVYAIDCLGTQPAVAVPVCALCVCTLCAVPVATVVARRSGCHLHSWLGTHTQLL